MTEVTTEVNELNPDPESRIKIYNVAVAAPGKCAVCGSAGGDGRHFIDFNFSLDWYGAVYFCTACMNEIAHRMGFVPDYKLEKRDALLMELRREYVKLEDRYRELRNAHRILASDCHCDADLVSVTAEPSVPDLQVSDELDVPANNETAGAESHAYQFGSFEGLGGVRKSAGSNKQRAAGSDKS